jgi:hypothetical protein
VISAISPPAKENSMVLMRPPSTCGSASSEGMTNANASAATTNSSWTNPLRSRRRRRSVLRRLLARWVRTVGL